MAPNGFLAEKGPRSHQCVAAKVNTHIHRRSGGLMLPRKQGPSDHSSSWEKGGWEYFLFYVTINRGKWQISFIRSTEMKSSPDLFQHTWKSAPGLTWQHGGLSVPFSVHFLFSPWARRKLDGRRSLESPCLQFFLMRSTLILPVLLWMQAFNSNGLHPIYQVMHRY